MARLGEPVVLPKVTGHNLEAEMAAENKAFAELQRAAAARPKGSLVGALVNFGVADGYAVYLVAKEKPLTLRHVPYGDAYQVHHAMIRGLTIEDVRNIVGADERLNQVFANRGN